MDDKVIYAIDTARMIKNCIIRGDGNPRPTWIKSYMVTQMIRFTVDNTDFPMFRKRVSL